MSPSDKVVRIFPKNPAQTPCHAYLSILDSSVANYTTCGAVFVFPYSSTSPSPPSSTPTASLESSANLPPVYEQQALIRSLSYTLDVYPQYAGTLRLVQYDPNVAREDHRRRFGRVELSWSQEDDPGVEMTARFRNRDSISSIDPQSLGIEQGRVRDGKGVERDLFVPSSSLVRLRASPDPSSRPSAMGVRVTYFSDGIAIGVGMHHSLGDATTLMRFMKDWSAIHRSLLAGASFPDLHRPFNPSILDAYASGNVDSADEDSAIRHRAMEIPQLRYDFWASNEGRPPIISTPGRPGPSIAALDESEGRKRGTPIPWHTWDWEAPVVDYLLEFTPTDIQHVYSSICAPGSTDSRSISRLDALLAHLWRLIIRARQVPSHETVYLDMSLGLRARLNPPLSPDFLGCPLTNVSPSLPASSPTSSVLMSATAIRDAIDMTALRLPDLLHHEAHSLDPIREWNAFMGSRHLMVTSWLSLKAEEVVFEAGGRVGWMHADMWPIDGLMVLMDRSSAPVGSGRAAEEEAQGASGNMGVQDLPRAGVAERDRPKVKERGKRWYDDGVVVRLVLQTEVMERLLADQELWPRGLSE